MRLSIFYSLSLIEASLISNVYTDYIEIQQLAKFSANPIFPGFNQQLLFELAKDGNFHIAKKFPDMQDLKMQVQKFAIDKNEITKTFSDISCEN